MKRLVTFLTLMTGAGLAFGQVVHNPGFVLFVNNETTKNVPHTVTNTDGTLLIGTKYNAELYYMNTTTASLTPIPATISPFKSTTATTFLGTWDGPATPVPLPAGYAGVDVYTDNSGEAVPPDGLNNGSQLYPTTMEVVAWDTTTGSTYETATIKGHSALFTFTQRFAQGIAGGQPSQLDQTLITQKGFQLVPEPSAIALSVMGIAGLLFLRRRK